MDQQLHVVLQVFLYTASGAVIVLAAVAVRAMSRFDQQLDRVARAVENLEAELIPLAREVRVVVDRLGDVSVRARKQFDAWERVSVGLLAPLVTLNRATGPLRAGATAFLAALWSGRPPAKPNVRAA
jgi:hypothetical protein